MLVRWIQERLLVCFAVIAALVGFLVGSLWTTSLKCRDLSSVVEQLSGELVECRQWQKKLGNAHAKRTPEVVVDSDTGLVGLVHDAVRVHDGRR
jgi:hypothetical protein